MTKTAFIKTYGCQMNVYDSRRIHELLESDGYHLTDDAQDADLILLNTCHIREKAAEKLYSDIGRMRKLANKATIAVAGCVAQAEGEEILTRARDVDLVLGPQVIHRLPNLLKRLNKEHGLRLVETELPDESKYDHLPKKRSQQGVSAFVSAQEGCDKFCTFCVVPYTRGVQLSRPVEDILDEINQLVDLGCVEITLLGQNVNAYDGIDASGKSVGLAGLIDYIAKIPNIVRIRFTTSHPRDMKDDLIALYGRCEKLMPYLHLPVQSGSDPILKRMNRGHDARSYFHIVEKLRKIRSDIALSGDFIVGFPGETDSDFEATLSLVRHIGYAQAYSFKYSPRPGTPAADMDDQVPESVKQDRLEQLQELLDAQQYAFNRSFIGREMQILLERKARQGGRLVGRSPWMQSSYVRADSRHMGRIVPCQVRDAGPNSLQLDIIEDSKNSNDIDRDLFTTC